LKLAKHFEFIIQARKYLIQTKLMYLSN